TGVRGVGTPTCRRLGRGVGPGRPRLASGQRLERLCALAWCRNRARRPVRLVVADRHVRSAESELRHSVRDQSDTTLDPPGLPLSCPEPSIANGLVWTRGAVRDDPIEYRAFCRSPLAGPGIPPSANGEHGVPASADLL